MPDTEAVHDLKLIMAVARAVAATSSDPQIKSETEGLEVYLTERVRQLLLAAKENAQAVKPDTSKPTQAPKPTPTQTDIISQAILDKLPWQTNSKGEWVFGSERDGSIKRDLVPLVQYLEKNSEANIGSHVYKLSHGKGSTLFLNRYPSK
ncbi:MAG: hypothetical protein HYY22_07840 [Thaumarchaeota archaeon]|nr:hypothetical protein [Nitrososphaerota archaeon]